MIRPRFLKRIRHSLLRLLAYCTRTSYSYSLFKRMIMTPLRLLQLILPCLCASWTQCWIPGTPEQETVNVISILYQIIPASSSTSAYLWLMFSYSILFIVYIASIFITAHIFQDHAKLPIWFSMISVLFVNTAGFFLPPIGLGCCGRVLSSLIWEPNTISIELAVAFILISLIVTIVWMWMFLDVICLTLYFRADSLQAASHHPGCIIFGCTLALHSLLNFGTCAPSLVRFGVTVASMIVFGIGFCSPFIDGGFIRPIASSMVLGGCVTGEICLIVNITFNFAGIPFSLGELFGVFAIFERGRFISSG